MKLKSYHRREGRSALPEQLALGTQRADIFGKQNYRRAFLDAFLAAFFVVFVGAFLGADLAAPRFAAEPLAGRMGCISHGSATGLPASCFFGGAEFFPAAACFNLRMSSACFSAIMPK
jgi:hypothetical protein